MLDLVKIDPDNWDADAAPDLEFLFEARVSLHFPAMDIGATPEGQRIIFHVTDRIFTGPHVRGRVVPNSGADWILIRPDGVGVQSVLFCQETYDGALIYAHCKQTGSQGSLL